MKNSKKKIWIFLGAVVVILILLLPGLRSFLKDQLMMKPAIEKLNNEITVTDSEYDIQLKGINTPDANLKDFQGKVLFLNFWGTWCPPCRHEWPSIQKLYGLKKDKMQFVLIAMQDQEADILKFLKEENYTVPVYIAQSLLPEKFLVKIFPSTFIIDKKGRILKKEEGAEDWSSASNQTFIDTIVQ
ncbi:redoxin family protein [Elizabethkingia argentiflava]|uniref:Redoxin family protein n=1 Tax=Elizabethkingia argenteiflava TaxID=2681556 RepID=A0A845PQ21_9FLAO|nr:TlpA disulfide reductase family protein [Elizabethkingia argenteiflava]NAW50409.1 redoxin family protein [Elizabethkingia argenteiflava]